MIKYSLICDQDHRFESWFQSSDAFDALSASGHLSCAVCGSADVKRGLMAPKVTTSRKRAAPPVPEAEIEKALTKLRDEVEKNSDYVGMNFAAEARAMHLGDAPERAIYGEAKLEEAKSLIEDGVPVAPLPFIPKRNTN